MGYSSVSFSPASVGADSVVLVLLTLVVRGLEEVTAALRFDIALHFGIGLHARVVALIGW
jgi:hypothetical protein